MSTTTEIKPCAMVDAWTHMDDVQFGNIPDGAREQTVFYFPRHKEMIQYEAKRVARLIAAASAMYKALCELECPDCGHTLEHHADKYNCDVERGDGYHVGSEILLEALGPCGCECLDCPDLLPLIAAIRLAKGESQ